MILRKLLIPFSNGIYALSVVHAAKKEAPPTCDPNRQLLRATELPLYPNEKVCRHCVELKAAADCPKKNILEETVSCARKELWFLMDQSKIVKVEVAEVLGTAIDHSTDALHYLQAEENIVPRVGAIALGGLTGFIFALRKRFLGKMFYSTLGAGAMAALCYPTEAKEYTNIALEQIRKYTLIGYHFLNGEREEMVVVEDKGKSCKCPPSMHKKK